MASLFLVFSLSIVSMLNLGAHAANLNFSFPASNDITEFGTASYDNFNKIMRLSRINIDGRPSWSFGLATYNKSVPLWKNTESSQPLANFTCHFKFSMPQIQEGEGNGFGDGLTFFMAPFDWEPPMNATARWLGLFNESTDGDEANQIVAVEFDTLKNDPFDEDNNHLGIDVNTIVSKVNISMNGWLTTLNDGLIWDAWVDYDGVAMKLQVFVMPRNTLHDVPKPTEAALWCHIDLRLILPENIKIGFSASTGGHSKEMHNVYTWEFSSQYSWEIADPGESPLATPTASPEKSPLPSAGKRPTNRKRVIVLLSVVACLVLLAIGGFSVLLARRWHINHRENKSCKEESRELDKRFAQGPRKFSHAELRTATKNFKQSEMLGKGGFGGVYRGILPVSNQPVAIKRISQGSKQGKTEYITEVTIISKMRHRNLVQLLGWCHEKGDLFLVYEFLPEGSLDMYLFGEQKRGHLDWGRRYKIACDITSALVYLHEDWDQRVVHRDIKASNIMLDGDFNAKLGDFGLARMVERNRSMSHTTAVAGTFGYLAPEYVISGKASSESDVFSFGAVTLEIACGRRSVDQSLDDHNWRLVEWVWDLYGQGKILDAVDRKLGSNFNVEEMQRLMLVGLLCSHPDPKARLTIRQVFNILKLEAQVPHVPPNFPEAVYAAKALPSPSRFRRSTSTIKTPEYSNINGV